MTYKITPKVIEDESCMVQNYRSQKKTWERGTVRTIEACLKPDGSFRLRYKVVLERRGKGRGVFGAGSFLFLTVGDDKIRPV